MMTNSYVQVPPQSTGKKIATVTRTQIYFDQAVGTFTEGQVLVGQSSGATGIITAAETEDYPVGSGELYLQDAVGTFVNNENLQVGVTTIAVADFDTDSQIVLDVQKTIIVDKDNLERSQRIDRFGATVNTFTDGSPIFGAFGALSVGEAQTIKNYRFAYDNLDGLFYGDVTGSGTLTWDTLRTTSDLNCSTLSGDIAKRTSHYYHPYIPGHGTQTLLTVQIGDTGKANVRRRWGYYDDDNGFFFELNGTDISVVLRSNVSGSVVNTVVAQADWNGDPLDGTDAIGFNLDVSKANIYWIDFQWLGAGIVRYGVYEPTGARIIAHTIQHANSTDAMPYTRTATLPIRYEQENTGVSISPSILRLACAVVQHSSKVITDGVKHSDDSGVQTITPGDGEVPIFSVRPALLYKGITNRGIWKGLSYTLANVTNDGAGPVRFRVRGGTAALLTGEAFAAHSASSMAEIDTTATAIDTVNAHQILTQFAIANTTITIQDQAPKELHTFELALQADDATQPVLTITAECLGGVSADVFACVNWEEFLL